MYLQISDSCELGSMDFGDSSLTNLRRNVQDKSTEDSSSSQHLAPMDVGGVVTNGQAQDDELCVNGHAHRDKNEPLPPNGVNRNLHKLSLLVPSCDGAEGTSSDCAPVEASLHSSSLRGNCFNQDVLHASSQSVSSDDLQCDGMDQYFEESFCFRNGSHSVSSNSTGSLVAERVDKGNSYSKTCCNSFDKNSVLIGGVNCPHHACVDAHQCNGYVSNGTDCCFPDWMRMDTCHFSHKSRRDDAGSVTVNNGLCSGDDDDVPLVGWHDPATPRNEVLSPDMDFLDFDFDPAPSGDEAPGAESDSSEGRPSSPPMGGEAFVPVVACHNDLGCPSDRGVQNRCIHSLSFQNLVSSPKYQNNCLRPMVRSNLELHNLQDVCSDNTDSDSANLEACGERLLRRESSLFNIPNEEMDYEEYNLQSALLNSFSAKPLANKQASFSPDDMTEEGFSSTSSCSPDEPPIDKVMIWSELEACNRQVTQIGKSACGATAVINVLMALVVPYEEEAVKKHIHTRLRAESAPVASYLVSRSSAGTTHEDLIAGIHRLTEGAVYGRFFHFYPTRNVQLLKWLGCWIRKGAVPIATLNLQCGVPSGQSIPDAWHHQMIFGVGPKGVYLTNPLECVSSAQISQQLCSDSVLLVRRNDVLSRWGDGYDLSPLFTHSNPQWRELNTVGQIVNVLRESTIPWVPGYRRNLTSHVKIPAAYKAGITLFVHKNSDAYNELLASSELPLTSQ